MNRGMLRQSSLLIALLLIWAVFTACSSTFVSARNLSQLAVEMSVTATLALGMLLIIVPGHIDLSVGSGVGLFGGLAAVLVFEHSWSAPRALMLAALVGVGIWMLMGALVVGKRLPSPGIVVAALAMAVVFFCLFRYHLDGPKADLQPSGPTWSVAVRLFLLKGFGPWWPSVGLSLVVGAGLGTVLWLTRSGQAIPAFIITLAGLLIFKGLHWLVIHNSTIPVQIGSQRNLYSALATWHLPPWLGFALAAVVVAGFALARFTARARRLRLDLKAESVESAVAGVLVAGQLIFLFVLVTNQFQGVPLSAVILAATALAVYIVTQHTPFGRHLYAIGGNVEAAALSGIPVQRAVIVAFGLMGLITALTGFMQTSYAGFSTPTVGTLMELDAIAACVIGGTSLKGGRGTVAGVLFGALIMVSLLNGLTLLAVAPEMKHIARGGVLALAVWMDVRLGRE